MQKIIIDLDTVTMALDAEECLDRALCRAAIDEIAERIERLLEERGFDVTVEREYRTLGRSDDSSEFHVEIETVLVGQVDAIRGALGL